MAKKKILFVSHQASLTGAPLFLLRLLKHLSQSKPEYEITVFFSNDGELTKQVSDQGIHHFISAKRTISKGIGRVVLSRTVHYLYYLKALFVVRPDLVYSNTCMNFGEVILAGLCRVPVIMHMHEGQQFASAFANRLKVSCYFTKQIIAGSEYAKNVLRTLTDKRAVVIYNGVEVTEEKAKPQKQPQTPLTLGMLGTIDANKGHHIAIEALELLYHKGHQVRLQIAGKVSELTYFKSLENLLKTCECAGEVTFLGVVEDSASFIRSLDVLLVPSFDEAFPTVVLEAFSQNTLVIASNVGGIPEMINDRSNGMLIEPGNPAALASAIEQIVCGMEILKILPHAAHLTLQHKFAEYRANLSIESIIGDHL
jgi:glycosyltransferase involved in cell wall biosynthesis